MLSVYEDHNMDSLSSPDRRDEFKPKMMMTGIDQHGEDWEVRTGAFGVANLLLIISSFYT